LFRLVSQTIRNDFLVLFVGVKESKRGDECGSSESSEVDDKAGDKKKFKGTYDDDAEDDDDMQSEDEDEDNEDESEDEEESSPEKTT